MPIPGTAPLRFVNDPLAGVGHLTGREQPLGALHVRFRPPAPGLSRREAVHVPLVVDPLLHSVDPAKAEPFLDRVVVAQGRFPHVLFVENQPDHVDAIVVDAQPASPV